MTALSLPHELATIIAGYAAQPVILGMSGATVYRLTQMSVPTMFLKICRDNPEQDGEQERARLAWMANKLPVPQVQHFVAEHGVSYLLMSEIPGADASNECYRSDTARIVRLLAQGLRMIHAVPVDDCPFDCSTSAMLAQARSRVAQGLVNEADFDAERHGRNAAELFDELVASRPATDDLVCTHGDYCLPNIVIDGDAISGFIDLGRAGVGDRYRDLALVARSLAHNGYAAGVALFFEAYGIVPDAEKLAFFQLMDEFF